MHFSHLCSSVIPNPIGTKFATENAGQLGGLHAKFEEHRSSHSRDTSEQSFVLISSSSFRTLCKIRHKTQMRVQIGAEIWHP